jgi:F420H(2)-dependent quinone reductase
MTSRSRNIRISPGTAGPSSTQDALAVLSTHSRDRNAEGFGEGVHRRWTSYSGFMPIDGEYEPSPSEWVRDQVAEYESSRGERANTLRDTGLPIVIVTTRGNKSGKIRKTALMRVEHDGEYALVASKGGAPEHPVWYYNLISDPTAVMVQDGPEPFDAVVREVTGDERVTWWDRAVAAYPPYADYQARTTRTIPVFVAGRQSS